MNNAQRGNQAQLSNPIMPGIPFIPNNFNFMPPPVQPFNSFVGFMPNPAPFNMPAMIPYAPMQQPAPMHQPAPTIIPQGPTMYNIPPHLNMQGSSTINLASIPVNAAALNLGSKIGYSGMNNSNNFGPNNFSNFPQPGPFQSFSNGRPY